MPSLIAPTLPVPGRAPAAASPSPAGPAPGVGPRPLLGPSCRHQPRGHVIVEPRTGPFEALSGRSVLVALDLENIDRSARHLGRAVDYRRLAAVLRAGIDPEAHLIAVFSRAAGEEAPERLLRAAGWATYARPIDTVRTKAGLIRHANADVAFATAVGAAAIALEVEACLLATGDGQLAIDVARCLTNIAPRCKTAATLSLPGSTSHRLDARRSDVFASNVEIGDDVMHRLPVPAAGGHARRRSGAAAPAARTAPA